MRQGQIIAMGGGGFSMEPDNLLLDQYILEQAHTPRPKICFVPTASGDADDYIRRFYRAFTQLECEPSHLSLFRGLQEDLRAYLADKDAIYVGGGNTRNLLVLWREWGLDVVMREAWKRGVVLAGVSAGSICWFESGLTDSIPGRLSPISALGFLPGSNCPHYDGEALRRPEFHRFIDDGFLPNGIAAEDGVGLHFVGTELKAIITSRPGAKAYRVMKTDSGIDEQALEPKYLGGKGLLIRRATPTDARGIHDAHMLSISEFCKNDYTPEQIIAWAGRPFDEQLRLSNIQNDFMWIIELDGKIEGVAGLEVDDKNRAQRARLKILYITPVVAKKRLGKRLLALAEEQAKICGASEINVDSTITAHGFYRRFGYKGTGPLTSCRINGKDIPGYPMKKIFKTTDSPAGV